MNWKGHRRYWFCINDGECDIIFLERLRETTMNISEGGRFRGLFEPMNS